MSDLFDTPTKVEDDKSIEDYKAHYVGEGKKYSSEEEAYKGLHNANNFIEQLQREQSELRTELEKRTTLEEFVGKLTEAQAEQLKNQSSNQDNQHQLDDHGRESDSRDKTPVPNMEGMSPEDVQNMIKDQISQTREFDTRSANAAKVQDKLRETWGNAYAAELEAKGRELGLSKDFMNEMAQTQPTAFLQLVGANTPKSSPGMTTPPKSQVSGLPEQTRNIRNREYYKNIRKTDPNRYFSVDMQNQMHRDALELGEQFDS